MFDCGIVFWSMLCGKKIQTEDFGKYKEKLADDFEKMGLKNDEVLKDLKNLLHAMLNPSPIKRPSIK